MVYIAQNLRYCMYHCYMLEATGHHTNTSFQEDILDIWLPLLIHCMCHLDTQLEMAIQFLDSKILSDNHCRTSHHQECIHQLSMAMDWCFYFDNCKRKRSTLYFLKSEMLYTSHFNTFRTECFVGYRWHSSLFSTSWPSRKYFVHLWIKCVLGQILLPIPVNLLGYYVTYVGSQFNLRTGILWVKIGIAILLLQNAPAMMESLEREWTRSVSLPSTFDAKYLSAYNYFYVYYIY